MRRLLILFVLVVAAVGGVGFYRGWFHLSQGGGDEHSPLPVVVDRDKIEQDKEKAKEKVQALEKKIGDKKANTGTDADKDQAPKPDGSHAPAR
jgi:hypothetical protein